jgi:hypothetical protein
MFAGTSLLTGVVCAHGSAPTTADCQACHGEPSMTRADGRPVVVDANVFEQSVHSVLSCTDCHTDLAKVTEFPHPEALAPVDCSSCHDDPVKQFAQSVHATLPAAAAGRVQCVSCHGPPHAITAAADPQSPTNKLRVASTCAQCHGRPVASGLPAGPEVAGQFADSIHGVALTKTTVAPTCSDCHRSHDIRRRTDTQSRVHPQNVEATCGTCHANQQRLYDSSVHAELVKGGAVAAPHCASCHSAHSIRSTASDAWQLGSVEQCGTCHREALATFRDTFHGQVTSLGFTPVAKCATCHKSHDVFRVADRRSSVSPANRLATCQSCHPSANQNFVKYQPHGNKHDRERSPALYYAGVMMNGLLLVTFSFFGLHTLLWALRERTSRADDEDGSHG